MSAVALVLKIFAYVHRQFFCRDFKNLAVFVFLVVISAFNFFLYDFFDVVKVNKDFAMSIQIDGEMIGMSVFDTANGMTFDYVSHLKRCFVNSFELHD